MSCCCCCCTSAAGLGFRAAPAARSAGVCPHHASQQRKGAPPHKIEWHTIAVRLIIGMHASHAEPLCCPCCRFSGTWSSAHITRRFMTMAGKGPWEEVCCTHHRCWTSGQAHTQSGPAAIPAATHPAGSWWRASTSPPGACWRSAASSQPGAGAAWPGLAVACAGHCSKPSGAWGGDDGHPGTCRAAVSCLYVLLQDADRTGLPQPSLSLQAGAVEASKSTACAAAIACHAAGAATIRATSMLLSWSELRHLTAYGALPGWRAGLQVQPAARV